MTEQTETNIASRQFPCPSCKASIAFDPKDGRLECPYCQWFEVLPKDSDSIVENSFEKYLEVSSDRLVTIGGEQQEVACDGCGARVTLERGVVAQSCSFCGRSVVVQEASVDPILAPQAVLAFGIDKTVASKSVKDWIRSRWFAPNALKRFALQEGIHSVYIPYWTYDTYTTTYYVGQRGDYYYVTETYTDRDAQGRSQIRTRRVRKTNWTSTSGTVTRFFDDVLVPAVTSISQEKLLALEPWDLPECAKFDQKFLAGHQALRYQFDFKTGFPIAQSLMESAILEDIRADIGGDEQHIASRKTSYSAVTFKHILLPVYIGAYIFQGKSYQVLLNARSGEIQGRRPYSYWKIFFVVVGVVVLGVGIFLLVRR
jgi:predicted RNA-binding Zn-ribbon protein involved in translation (DUF1610 family)